MKANYDSIYEGLLLRLRREGVTLFSMPLLVKDLMHSFSLNPAMECSELNSRIHLLGWGDVEVDYHICELARAAYEMRE
jgi:hypothetical protein